MLVSRVFASAQFRGHAASLERMARLARTAEQRGIVLVNPGRAHFFEVDKRRATETLAAAGLVTPAVYACAPPAGIDAAALAYPCVLKPNCGGRTTCTAIARSADEARAFLAAGARHRALSPRSTWSRRAASSRASRWWTAPARSQ